MSMIQRLCAALACFAALWAAAESPLRLVVGFPPGGGADVVARLVAERMRDSVGPIVVENKPGAGGQVAAKLLVATAPDGRTLMVTSPAPTVLASVTYRKLPYDPIADFTPVSLAAEFQFALVVGPATPGRTLEEYVAWIREDPRRAQYGITATGGLVHLFGLMLSRRVGVEMVHVPYSGGAPMAAALLGGQVPAAIMLVAEAIELHRAGKLSILATSGTARTALDASIPTFAERGYPEMVGSGWIAFYAPPNTARHVVERLSGAIGAAVRSPDVSERLVKAGYVPVGSSPEEFARRIAEDVAKWRPVVAANNLVVD